MFATHAISWVFVCFVLFTETNALRGALFRTGKGFWPGSYNPYIVLLESDKSPKMIDAMDYNNGNQNVLSSSRGINKAIYLQQ